MNHIPTNKYTNYIQDKKNLTTKSNEDKTRFFDIATNKEDSKTTLSTQFNTEYKSNLSDKECRELLNKIHNNNNAEYSDLKFLADIFDLKRQFDLIIHSQCLQ